MRILRFLASVASRLLVYVFLAIAPAIMAAAGADRSDLASLTAALEEEIETILDETGIPSISLALIRDGEVVWADAFGYANVGARVPATPDTYYNTGSTFKFVTATALMQLVEKGAVALDTPLNDIVGADLAIDNAGDVTVRHLLSHRSGLDAFVMARRIKTTESIAAVPLWGWQAHISPEELLSQTRLARPPGTEFKYSNDGYVIAGYILERLSGMSYDEYVAENVLRPLGIDIDRPSVPSPRVVEHMALPYSMSNNLPVAISQVRYDAAGPGDVYLKASDMARFVAAQLNGGEYDGGRILSPASTNEMRRRQFAGPAYGLGVSLARVDGHELIQHSGGIPGFKSIMVAEPAARQGVYVMTNASGSGNAQGAIGAVAHHAMQLMWDGDVSPIKGLAVKEAIPVSPKTLDRYVGEYVLSPERSLVFSRVENRFFVRSGDHPPLEVFAASETNFFLRQGQATVTFGRDEEDGPVNHLILHESRGDRRADRLQEGSK